MGWLRTRETDDEQVGGLPISCASHAHGVASMGCCCSGLLSQRRQQLLSEIKHRLIIEAYVIEVGQDVPLRDRDRCRLSLDNTLSPEVLARFDDTQPVAITVMWSPIVLVWRLVF